MLNIPSIQSSMSEFVAKELGEHLHTELRIGRINMGLLNRIIIEDLYVEDLAGKDLLKVSRLSARFDILELLKGKISINSVQLFGFDLKLAKPSLEDELNLQFIIDAFQSSEPKKESNLDLRINSLLIRRGKLSYDVEDQPHSEHKFNAHHLKFNNIVANISLKALRPDSINASIKRFSVNEASGLELKKLALKVVANPEKMQIQNFEVALPQSKLQIDTINLAYAGIKSFDEFADEVEFSLKTLPSYITLGDLSPFVPGFKNFKERINLDLEVNGTIDQLNCSHLYLNGDNHLFLRGSGTVENLSHPKDAFIYASLSRFSIDQQGMEFLVRNLNEDFQGIPPILTRMGTTSFQGELSGYPNDFVTYGVFRSSTLGNIRTDVKFSKPEDKGLFSYKGSISTQEFNLAQLSNSDQLGLISFNLHVEGIKEERKAYPNVKIQGNVSEFDFSGYNYENISIDGLYKEGGFDGQLSLDDENGLVDLNGSINIAQAIPSFNFEANIIDIRPYQLNLSKRDEDERFSVNIVANFTGGSIDKMNGEININNLDYHTSFLEYKLDNFKVQALHTDEYNKLLINSKFLRAHIDGQYSYKTLLSSIINTTKRYLPSLTSTLKTPAKSKNNFSFEVDLEDTEILTHLFNIPFQTFTHSTLKGYFDDEKERVHIEGYFPKLRYKNVNYESAMILFENPSDELTAHIRLTQQKSYGAVNISLNALAKEDIITTSLNWGNTGAATYSGKFNTETFFQRIKDEKQKPYLKTQIKVLPSDVILNDTTWQIHPSEIEIAPQLVKVNNFLFSNERQFLQIDGQGSISPQDTLFLNLNDIDLGYIFDIANIKEDVDFKGKTTGRAIVSNLFDKPNMNTNLHVNNFTFNDGLLGDMDVYGFWDNDTQGIFLDAEINENDLGSTYVTGFVYPIAPKSGLDLDIIANGTNIKFLEGYMADIANDVKGRAYGSVRLHGQFKTLNLEGDLLADASLRIGVLNTHFALNDSLYFTPNGIEFKDIHLRDLEGHTGKLKGALHYQHFKNLKYQFDINANNLLVMNTKESPDLPFYGKIYATGNTILRGDQAGLNVDASVRTDKNTQFTFITNATASAASNQFIHFNDKTPYHNANLEKPQELDMYGNVIQEDTEYDSDIDIRLNLQIEATPEANVKIILDPIAGDYMTAAGTGNIRMEFYNKGDVRLFGSYEIQKGMYKFSLQEVIRKDFTIMQGSSISFNGRPLDANLNIRAQYTVNSVSLTDLIPSENSLTSQSHIKVNCILGVTGQLTSPNITFDLDLPNEHDEVRSLVKNYINTEEQMNMQVLYLLGIGKFYMADNANNNQSSDMMSSVLSSTLSGQLNDILSQMINNNNWSFGTNVSTGSKGWTDVEVEGMLSAQLLNNRLLINGNFGYRDNPMATTNFVGDFEAEWLLNRSGNIRLRGYSKTNDRYLIRTNLTTQGVGIMFRKDFLYWKELFFWNTIKLRRQARKEAKLKEQEAVLRKSKEEKEKELAPIQE
ncbi:protein of unknown function DUF490 [Bacteroides coprosuis DSM 18011]|uniref:Translocation and assembly module TamB C-terminal domain-containing protein n=1 Tax=Bacteroides coprosuis DSM 18011 TaxID=679937 RepID=F3ZUX4_9BACE|nr:translocation/assembly module TamB domain-containing protein [Bacteroides coprosuis]EGJ71434.1 protein of unknown function DUF490 [Bacteroides coprosuis DSM 18011]HJD92397.1 translocation/assembly module TamB [Bacteroides coprosuis]